MSDQQRGYSGWPAPVDPRRDPRAANRQPTNGHHANTGPTDVPPWTGADFVAPDEVDDVPWDHPADMPWFEPEADFDHWTEADGRSFAEPPQRQDRPQVARAPLVARPAPVAQPAPEWDEPADDWTPTRPTPAQSPRYATPQPDFQDRYNLPSQVDDPYDD